MTKVVKNSPLVSFMNSFSGIISSADTNSMIRSNTTDFIRKRSMPFDMVLYYLIFRNQRCAEDDLVRFFSNMDILDHKISKQALHKNLRKVNPNVFLYLYQKYAQLFYSSKLPVLYRDKYTVLAEDGTFLQIPYLFSNIEYFGVWKTFYVKDALDVNVVQSKASGLYDVTNGFFADFIMKSVNYSELPLAYLHLYRTADLYKGRNVIYLADRYYGSAELISTLEALGYRYCIRGKSNFYKKQISAMKSSDEEIEVTVDEKWLKRFKNSQMGKEYRKEHPVMKIRVVKTVYTYLDKKGLPVTNDLVYLTNLPEDEFSSEDIVSLYSKRWDIEVAYKVLKSKLELERHISRNRYVAQSVMYGKIMFYNIAGVFRKQINHQFEKNPRISEKEDESGNKATEKTVYAVNISQLINCISENGIMKNMFMKNKRELARRIEQILKVCEKMKVPVRPDRHNERWGRVVPSGYYYRFSLDGRNFPKLKTIKGVMRTTKP